MVAFWKLSFFRCFFIKPLFPTSFIARDLPIENVHYMHRLICIVHMQTTHFLCFFLTCSSICVNCDSLLIATRFSQLISVIHFAGLVGDVLRSRAAPPTQHKMHVYVSCHYQIHVHVHISTGTLNYFV